MGNLHKSLQIFLQVKELVVALAALALWILALWFSYKLFPVMQDLGTLKVRADTNDREVIELKQGYNRLYEIASETKEDVSYIRGKIDGQDK